MRGTAWSVLLPQSLSCNRDALLANISNIVGVGKKQGKGSMLSTVSMGCVVPVQLLSNTQPMPRSHSAPDDLAYSLCCVSLSVDTARVSQACVRARRTELLSH